MKKWAIGILVVVLVLAVYMGSEESSPKQTVVHDLSDVSYTQIENGIIYEVSELTVVERYAYSHKDFKTTVEYYLVVFRDANNRLIAASMPVYASDEIHSQLSYYNSNEDLLIGDCVLDCHVKAIRFQVSSGDVSELKEFFADAVSDYTEVFGEPLYPLEWQLDYYCASWEDPLK